MAGLAIKNRFDKGLTLIEMIVSLSIMAIVFAAIVPQFRILDKSWDSKQGSAQAVQNLRILADHVNRKLSTSAKVVSVSSAATGSGFIEFEGNDGLTYRYDVDGQGYVQYGTVGSQQQLAGPVNKLQFSCFALDDMATAITDVDSIRFVRVSTELVNTYAGGQNKGADIAAYINSDAAIASSLFETDATESLEKKKKADVQIATQAVLSEDGTVTSILGYIKGPPPKKLRFAIYTDNSGEPGNLIVESAVDTVTSNAFYWHEIAVTSTHLTAGTYWLTMAFEHKNQYYNHSSSGQGQLRYKNNDAVTNGFTSQWTSSDDSGTERVSIYASYTAD